MSDSVQVQVEARRALERALAPGVTADDLMMNLLPVLHRPHARASRLWVAAPVTIRINLQGTVDEIWDVTLRDGEISVARGTVVQSPFLILTVGASDWYGVKAFLEAFEDELGNLLQWNPPPPRRPLDAATIAALASLDAGLDFVLHDLFSDGDARASLTIGGTAQRGTVRIAADTGDLEDVLDGVTSPLELWRDGRLRISGDTGLLARLGTVLAPILPGH
ncbi:MAG: hypothetical protein EA398_06305 [Deltaproteobacteria bacterium]|nr:MAG: hypothetical protein EA398_06305 [Deltaproteobacteria bacterium]